MSARPLTCTRKEAERRRWELRSRILLTLPADELAAFMDSPKPPTALDLVHLAQRKAVHSDGSCPHCGKPVLIAPSRIDENAEKLPVEPKPFTPNAHAREAKPRKAL